MNRRISASFVNDMGSNRIKSESAVGRNCILLVALVIIVSLHGRVKQVGVYTYNAVEL